MSSRTAGKIIRYIQQALYEGKEPDANGYYKFSRKELSEGAQISTSTFDSNRADVESYFARWCDLEKQGKYPELKHEMLYIDVCYEKGYFMFRRNPITLQPELQHLWALPPLADYFCYDCYDEQHRRRTNGPQIYGAFPWRWTEEQIQETIKNNAFNIPAKKEVRKSTVAKKSDEEKRIDSIRQNGGCHLQNFKEKNITYAMCLVAVENDGYALRFVPEKFKTEEIYRAACKSCGSVLTSVPKEFLCKEIYELAVASCGGMIDFVPEEYLSKDMYLSAACNDPLIMQKMPSNYLTTDFCIEVIKIKGKAAISSIPKAFKTGKFYLPLVEAIPEMIWYIPKTGRTSAVCKAAVKGLGYKSTADAIKDKPKLLCKLHTALYDYETSLSFVASELFLKAVENKSYGYNTSSDDENGMLYLNHDYDDHYSMKHLLRWEDICLLILEKMPLAIRYVSEDILTQEMCNLAVAKNHRAFNFVPEKYKTYDLCIMAFKQEPHHIERIPDKFHTYELWLDGVGRSGYLLRITPKEYLTRELCMKSMERLGSEIRYVPKDVMDEELCLTALHNLGGASYQILRDIPEEYRTYAVCLAAVQADSGSFNHVPVAHRTYELCLAAAKKSPSSVKDIPEDYYTEEFCLTLVEHSGYEIKRIPKHRLTEKVCLQAISRGDRYAGTMLGEVPDEMITQEMCDLSVKISPRSFHDVPERFVTEGILMSIALNAPGILPYNFPDKFKTKPFIMKLIEINVSAANYISRFLDEKE